MSFVNLALNPIHTMPKQSAGILLFHCRAGFLQVLLVHPGGPFFKNKDKGAWSIPKGEFSETEQAFDAAKREFREETGFDLTGNFVELQPVVLKSGKKIVAWALQGDLDTTKIKSNFFDIQWPPRSGTIQSFPEIDKAEWFALETAKVKINEGQLCFLEQLVLITDFK